MRLASWAVGCDKRFDFILRAVGKQEGVANVQMRDEGGGWL